MSMSGFQIPSGPGNFPLGNSRIILVTPSIVVSTESRASTWTLEKFTATKPRWNWLWKTAISSLAHHTEAPFNTQCLSFSIICFCSLFPLLGAAKKKLWIPFLWRSVSSFHLASVFCAVCKQGYLSRDFLSTIILSSIFTTPLLNHFGTEGWLALVSRLSEKNIKQFKELSIYKSFK